MVVGSGQSTRDGRVTIVEHAHCSSLVVDQETKISPILQNLAEDTGSPEGTDAEPLRGSTKIYQGQLRDSLPLSSKRSVVD